MTSQIDSWLNSLGLAKHVSLFEREEIDEEVLAELSDEDLEKIGLPLGARKKILKAIENGSLPSVSTPEEPVNTTDIAAGTEAERRHLSIMFCDLVDSTRMSRQLDPEDLREINRAYQDTVSAAIESFGGYIARYMGDGVLAYFGYPQAYEDAAERAVRAGLAAVGAVTRMKAELGAKHQVDMAIRVGVATGPVIVGDLIGKGAAQESAVVGETPNLAARLQGAAGPDQVVVSAETQLRVGESILFEELDRQSLKGFDTPVQAWRVLATRSAGGRFERSVLGGLGRFVGRQAELESLQSYLSRVLDGETVVTHLIGEPGIGKSRLVHEFLAEAGEQAIVLQGHCTSHGMSTTLMPFIDLVRRELDTASDASPEVLAQELRRRFDEWDISNHVHIPYLLNLLGAEVPELAEVDSGLVGYRTREALRSIVLARDSQRPVILYINDCHWIDKSSEALLENLITSETSTRLMILCSFRPEYDPPWNARVSIDRIRLGLLTAAETRALLVDRFIDQDITEDLLEELYDRSNGNPYFAEELVHHVQGYHPNSNRDEHGKEQVSVPRSLEGLLLERVDRLSAPARRLLQIASVMGRNFNAPLAAEIAGNVNQQDSLQELIDQGLVYPDTIIQPHTHRFKHALLNDAVYGSLLNADRIRVHKAIADGLLIFCRGRETEILGELARHSLQARDHAAAAHWSALAGEKGLRLFDCETASSWFKQALGILTAEPASNSKLLGSTLVNQMEAHCWEMDFSSLVNLAEQNLPHIEAAGDSLHISRTYTWLADAYINTGNFAQAAVVSERAMTMGEELDNLEGIGYALCMRLWLQALTGNLAEIEFVESESSRLYDIARQLNDIYLETQAYHSRALDLIQRGYFEQARNWIDKSLAMGEKTDYSPALVWPLCLRAHIAIFEGTAEYAERDALEAMRFAQSRYDRFYARMTLAAALIGQGKTREGLKSMKQINREREAQELSLTAYMYWPEIVYASGLLEDNQAHAGVRFLEGRFARYIELGNRRAAAMAALQLAEACLEDSNACENGETSAGWFRRARDLAEESGMNRVIAQALVGLAQVSVSDTDSAKHLAQASEYSKKYRRG